MAKLNWEKAKARQRATHNVADDDVTGERWLMQNETEKDKRKRIIAAGMTKNGGFTRAQLERWGVSWPPTKGWKESIIEHGFPWERRSHL